MLVMSEKVLTAMAGVGGASVILFDPIFQGLTISLMARGNRLPLNQPHGGAGTLFHGVGAPQRANSLWTAAGGRDLG
jgi:hypothetical protein